MIGRLQGVVLEKNAPGLLLDVGGVGYEIEAPMSTFYRLPDLGAEVVLLIHMLVREDAQQLFGFATDSERRMFRYLIKVSGIGARMGLAILSGMSVNELARCLSNGDVALLTRIPGIGKKTAERLVLEMRDRISEWEFFGAEQPLGSIEKGRNAVDDAIGALQALGYKSSEAKHIVGRLEAKDKSSEDLIREALKLLVS